MTEEEFRTESRANLFKKLVEISRKSFPTVGHADIDVKLSEAFAGAKRSEVADAHEISEWMKANLSIDVSPEQLTGIKYDQARDILWNAFDARHRPEMRRMERSLLLNQLDLAWKNHLLAMDHLRTGHRPGRLRPDRSEDRVQARRHEGIRHEVGGPER